MKTIAVIGLGNRGTGYMLYTQKLYKKLGKIVAICDIDREKLAIKGKQFGIPQEMCFADDEEFFAERRADVIFICTQDRDHYGHAMRAIALGYDILMEKPVSPVIAECEEIRDAAAAAGVRVVVCHVLRYSSYYKKLNEIIKSGKYGKVMQINHTENIGDFHFAHSYVRGNWHREEETTPMLMAKCCHDFDLIHWFMEGGCRSVTSVGALSYFCRDNAPAGCAERCLDCPKDIKKKCKYDAEYEYITSPIWRANFVKFLRTTVTGKMKAKRSDLYEALRTRDYGRCVFLSDNDVMDHQTTMMDYGDGRYATVTTTAFSSKMFRRTAVHMEKADIFCRDDNGVITVNEFSGRSVKYRTGILHIGHVTGDIHIVKNFLRLVNGLPVAEEDVTTIATTVESHRIVLAAEQSRHADGELVRL